MAVDAGRGQWGNKEGKKGIRGGLGGKGELHPFSTCDSLPEWPLDKHPPAS